MKLSDKPIFISKEEAIAALPDSPKIHSFLGMFGADWDRTDVISEINKASRVAFTAHMMNHELALERDGQSVIRFDVQSPSHNHE